ncbi:MAG: biotin/lipoyl-containing protein [Thermoplasmatota archaeon]
MKGGRGRLRLGAEVHDVELRKTETGWHVTVDEEAFDIGRTEVVADVVRGVARVGAEELQFRVEEWTAAGNAANGAAAAHTKVRSPMSGKLVEVRVAAGAAVGKGDVLFVLEAMKMQNEVRSPAAGVVVAVQAKAGETLDTERVVVEIQPG